MNLSSFSSDLPYSQFYYFPQRQTDSLTVTDAPCSAEKCQREATWLLWLVVWIFCVCAFSCFLLGLETEKVIQDLIYDEHVVFTASSNYRLGVEI